MHEYVHDKELQPKIFEKDNKILDDKKNLENKLIPKTDRQKHIEPNIVSDKIKHTHQNEINKKLENNKINKTDNL